MYSSRLPPNNFGWPTLGVCPILRFLGLGGGAGGLKNEIKHSSEIIDVILYISSFFELQVSSLVQIYFFEVNIYTCRPTLSINHREKIFFLGIT